MGIAEQTRQSVAMHTSRSGQPWIRIANSEPAASLSDAGEDAWWHGKARQNNSTPLTETQGIPAAEPLPVGGAAARVSPPPEPETPSPERCSLIVDGDIRRRESTRPAELLTILVLDADLRVVDANPAARACVDQQCLFSLDHGLLSCVDPTNASHFRRLVRRACSSSSKPNVKPSAVRLRHLATATGWADVIVAPAPVDSPWRGTALVLVESMR